jgi:predicted nucleic acid-binding protein
MGLPLRPLIVVSNTSPLTNLAAIGRFDLLQSLFGHLQLSTAVVAELSAGGQSWPGAKETASAAWITVHSVRDRHTIDALRLELDAGEAETIVLALQLQADLVLLDEQAGRRAAQYFGLKVMGVVGLLLQAKQRQLIPAVRPLLENLQHHAGFYLSQDVVEHALKLVGEQ